MFNSFGTPWACSLPGSSVHGISQARILEWVAISFFPAAAKSLQSCPTLCNPIDGSPLGSSVPGILQARRLEWVAISFSKAWKWKVKVKSLSRARLLATPWTGAYQAPPSMGFSRQEYWSGVPMPSPFLLPYPGSNPHLLHWQGGSLPLRHLRSPTFIAVLFTIAKTWASLVAQLVKNPPAMRETWFWSLGWKDPLEKGKATHSSILAWRTVQSMGSQRVGHDLVTFTFTFQDMEATWMTINRWTDKDVIHTYNGLLLSHKKERNWVICREVDGPRDYHTKWRKSGGERQTQYDITYMWNLTYDTRGLIYAAEMDPQT